MVCVYKNLNFIAQINDNFSIFTMVVCTKDDVCKTH